MSEISDETLKGLAAKFETLDLSEDERAVIDEVLERAADGTPETSGFVASKDELLGMRLSFQIASVMGPCPSSKPRTAGRSAVVSSRALFESGLPESGSCPGPIGSARNQISESTCWKPKLHRVSAT